VSGITEHDGPVSDGFYGRDLAHSHDEGYGDVARAGAAALVRELRAAGIDEGLVVELGSGSGIAARALGDAGYDVIGFELSSDFVALARERAPGARFEIASLWDAELPSCAAVASFGECVSYAVDPRAGRAGLARLFVRAYAALRPGGLLMLDLVTPGRDPSGPRSGWREGSDWLVCFEAEENVARRTLERRIVVFRRDGDGYRRSDEVHAVRTYDPAAVLDDLTAAGFAAQRLDGYGDELRFPPGVAGFLGRAPL
jgi:SAM-dependent methyltransferase